MYVYHYHNFFDKTYQIEFVSLFYSSSQDEQINK